ncbi:hypothetical protein PR048_002783, partial [Dryococelus australis]
MQRTVGTLKESHEKFSKDKKRCDESKFSSFCANVSREEIWAALNSEVLKALMRVIEVSMEQRRSERAGETGDTRENPPSSDIVQHNSHVRKSGSDPTGYLTRFALVGGKCANRSATAAPQMRDPFRKLCAANQRMSTPTSRKAISSLSTYLLYAVDDKFRGISRRRGLLNVLLNAVCRRLSHDCFARSPALQSVKIIFCWEQLKRSESCRPRSRNCKSSVQIFPLEVLAEMIKTEQRRNARAGETRSPRKTRRPVASSSTIPTCENPGLALVGGEKTNRSTTAAPQYCTEKFLVACLI